MKRKTKWLKTLATISLLTFSLSTSYGTDNKGTPLVDLLDSTIYSAPETYWQPDQDQGVIKALFYSTLPYKGKETRAFAYIGIPESDNSVPAIVLVHGGGGTAFHEWVKIWNDRGYAAISMSLEGHMPNTQGEGKIRHNYSGPKRVGRFDDIELPFEEQWMYHAVSDIILAHSLLASLSEIDANRIGITGISWGGILSSLVSGVDTRLKCAMPVYGAGYLYESKGHFGKHGDRSPEFIEKKKFWDPVNQFAQGSVPTLWVNGDSDGHFSLNITSHSFKTSADHAFLSVHPKMRHGHRPGWDPMVVPEIYAFADHILKEATPGLASIKKQPSSRKCNLRYKSETNILKATIYYLNEPLTYRHSENEKHPSPGTWLSKPAEINTKNNSVRLELPKECMTYYVNLEDERGLIVSSVLVEL